MKIAFLVIAHTDANQLRNLVDRLAPNCFFDSKIFIHIDKKSDISKFDSFNDKNYVKYTSKRINVVRCGVSQVQAVLELMRSVISTGERFDRYVVITGQDYPVISNKELAERLSYDIEYMRCYKVTGSHMSNKVRRYYFYNKLLVGSKFKETFRRMIQFIFRLFRKKDTVEIYGRQCDIYYSSAYFGVSHELFCELYEKGIDKKYFKYFKTSITSDEMYFATIAANSQFREMLEIVDNKSHTLIDNSSITYFDYQERPIVLTEKHYSDIKKSNRMFARKFSSIESVKLISMLNE